MKQEAAQGIIEQAGQQPGRAAQQETIIFHAPMKLWFYDGGREIVCDGQPGYYERFYGPNATERDKWGVWSCQFIGIHNFHPDECPVCNPTGEDLWTKKWR